MQERVESDLSTPYVQHQSIERFVVNTHAFHNAHRLRKALKRPLFEPLPLYPPEMRKEKHIELARNLQAAQKAKLEARTAAQKQREATMPADNRDSLAPRKRARMEVEDHTQSQITA